MQGNMRYFERVSMSQSQPSSMCCASVVVTLLAFLILVAISLDTLNVLPPQCFVVPRLGECFTAHGLTAPLTLQNNDAFVFRDCTFSASSSIYFVVNDQIINVSILLEGAIVTGITQALFAVVSPLPTTGVYATTFALVNSCVLQNNAPLVAFERNSYLSTESVQFSFTDTNISSTNAANPLVVLQLSQLKNTTLRITRCRMHFTGNAISAVADVAVFSAVNKYQVIVADSQIYLKSAAVVSVFKVECKLIDIVHFTASRSQFHVLSEAEGRVVMLTGERTASALQFAIDQVAFNMVASSREGFATAVVWVSYFRIAGCKLLVRSVNSTTTIDGIEKASTSASIFTLTANSSDIQADITDTSWRLNTLTDFTDLGPMSSSRTFTAGMVVFGPLLHSVSDVKVNLMDCDVYFNVRVTGAPPSPIAGSVWSSFAPVQCPARVVAHAIVQAHKVVMTLAVSNPDEVLTESSWLRFDGSLVNLCKLAQFGQALPVLENSTNVSLDISDSTVLPLSDRGIDVSVVSLSGTMEGFHLYVQNTNVSLSEPATGSGAANGSLIVAFFAPSILSRSLIVIRNCAAKGFVMSP